MVRLGARQHSPVDSVVSYVFLFGALEGSRAAAGIPIKPKRRDASTGIKMKKKRMMMMMMMMARPSKHDSSFLSSVGVSMIS